MSPIYNFNNPFSNNNIGLAYHYELLADKARATAFKKAIDNSCQGKIVIESGTGSGILSILAARAGAKFVYATEEDPQLVQLAEQNFRLSGLSNIKLIPKNTLEVNLSDLGGNRTEVAICGNFCTWQLTQPEIEVANHITQYLAAPNAVRVPTKISNCIELAESDFVFHDGVHLRVHYFELGGAKPPKLISAPQVFSRLDHSRSIPTHNRGYVDIKVTAAGTINSLRLSSNVSLLKDIELKQKELLMPATVVPIAQDLKVKKGDTVRVFVDYETCSAWENFNAEIEIVNPQEPGVSVS